MSATPSASPTPRPRHRRWLFVPLSLLLVVLLFILWAYLRGSTAETTARIPTDDLPTSQVYQTPEGQPTVRAAIVLNHPREKVWNLVTDYDKYGDMLPYLREVSVEKKDGESVLTGKAAAAMSGYWDFSLTAHEKKDDKIWRAGWEERGEGAVRLNRGGWTLETQAPDKTLLVLELEAEVKGYPNWVLRNFFLYRLKHVLESVKTRLKDK